MITGLDHYIILVNDLEAAMESFRGLGFNVELGGVHSAFGSRNALVPFVDGTYVELLTFQDANLAAQTFWADSVKKLQVREGFDGFAVQSNDIASDVERIRHRGLKMDEPQPGSRNRPDGERVAWRTARSPEPFAPILPFLIQDETSHSLRIESAREGLGSHVRPKELVIAVNNAEVARQAYRELFDIEPKPVQNAARDVQGYRVTAPWGSIVLARPERRGNALSEQLSQRGEGLYAITFGADDINQVRNLVRLSNVSVEDETYGFMIAPSAVHGARLRFLQGESKEQSLM